MSLDMLAKDTEVKKSGDKDTLGGGFILESGVYGLTIETAYIEKAKSGALMVNISAKTDEGKQYKENFCVRSGDTKGNNVTYTNKGGDKFYLPGYSIVDALCEMVTDGEISDLSTEEKVISIWNFEAGEEMPTKVNMITELLGVRVKAGILRVVTDKTKKGDDNKYHPTGETKEINEVNKWFDYETSKSNTEIKAGVDADFINAWSDKNNGVDKVTAKGAKDGATKGAPTAAKKKETESLFD